MDEEKKECDKEDCWSYLSKEGCAECKHCNGRDDNYLTHLQKWGY